MKEIGKIVSVHGVDGDLVIAHCISGERAAAKLKVLMVELWAQSYIPFFIEKMKDISGEDMLVKFEEIGSREEAKKMLNKKVFVFDDKSVQTNRAGDWGFLSAYQIIDQQGSPVGIVERVVGHGMQILIETNYKGRTIHLPLHEDLIMKLDKESGVIHLTIAAGLLEMWD